MSGIFFPTALMIPRSYSAQDHKMHLIQPAERWRMGRSSYTLLPLMYWL